MWKLVPRQFFGVGKEGVENQKLLFRHVDRFIRMRRFESPSLHEVCAGLKVSDLLLSQFNTLHN